MDFLQAFIYQIDYLTYSFPAAVLVLMSREWAVINLMRTQDMKSSGLYANAFSAIDPLALFCLSLVNISWGNFLQKERRDHWVSYLIAQLALLLLMLILIFYLKMNKPPKEEYLFLFCNAMIQQSWAVFLFNLVPIPPFDLSFFYMQRPALRLICLVSKIGLLVLLLGNFFNIADWIPQV